MPSEAARTLLTLSFVPGIGQQTLLKLAAHPKFLATDIDQMAALHPTVAKRLTPESLDQALAEADDNIQQAQQDGAQLYCILDDAYPALLKATPDAPPFIFVKGTLKVEQTVSIIGTREPTEHGTEIAKRITEYFLMGNWSIVSGLALGVDSIAHRTAVEGGGHTVAVLAHGLQTVAPRQHAQLARDILNAGGALVTEYPYGKGVFPAQYVKRDRIQAGLSQGVVMVQSDIKGGSLHASRAAVEYGRILAVPQPTKKDVANKEPKVQGNLELLGDAKAAASLLNCQQNALSRVLSIRSKEDYPVLEERLLEIGPERSDRLF